MERVAALASGGLDSSVLLADLAQEAMVFPLYVQMGLAWEEVERRALNAFVDALRSPNVQPITTLSVPVRQVYGQHWSLTGIGVPGAEAPDSAVFLPGRNVLLIGLAAVWCSTHGVSRIAIGSLGGNPFPDATPDFFESFGRALSLGLAHPVSIEAPYRGLHKEDLIRQRQQLPLELTLTCMAPTNGIHCGRCNKCHERQVAFATARVADRTRYAA
ncbi:MAG: 7-cyano-7-deazaguanine synthase [Chloroflexi bacterium]|nr:7-cyano-7-deazaguanine synthase [Chloroflexota bacterium]